MLFSSPFQPEPPHRHGQPQRTAVLYCNLGTPDEPTAPALRRYLAQFLGDHRVVEIPKPLWWLILHGIILRVRPAKSAAKYASVWTAEGSPLKVWTAKQATLLQGFLGERGHHVTVRYAMTYGHPSVASELDRLKAEGHTRILLLPAYPQYSGTTTAPLFDQVYAWGQRTRHLPELRFVNRFHDHPAYIQALAHSVRAHWQRESTQGGQADKLVMSFHGVPERTLHLGDPYHCECHKTARLLAQALGLAPTQYVVTFQSRFGKAKWLEPYTEPTLVALAQKGVKSVDVICPGFPADCLETLEEINQEAREAFLHAGGQRFGYIPCLNDSAPYIHALADLAEAHLGGWPTRTAPNAEELAASQARATGMDAKA
jgi:ferrochelatase